MHLGNYTGSLHANQFFLISSLCSCTRQVAVMSKVLCTNTYQAVAKKAYNIFLTFAVALTAFLYKCLCTLPTHYNCCTELQGCIELCDHGGAGNCYTLPTAITPTLYTLLGLGQVKCVGTYIYDKLQQHLKPLSSVCTYTSAVSCFSSLLSPS